MFTVVRFARASLSRSRPGPPSYVDKDHPLEEGHVPSKELCGWKYQQYPLDGKEAMIRIVYIRMFLLRPSREVPLCHVRKQSGYNTDLWFREAWSTTAFERMFPLAL